MTIFPNGSRAAINGTSTGYFTGQVRIDPVFDAEGAARASVGHVTFEPGARTKWHTHPIGQLLIVSQGSGYVCKAGEAPQPIRAGDVVWIAAGEKHWHGAAPDTAMGHFAVQEFLDGKNVDWLEPVSDADYVCR